jgi:hypothetical protein
MTSGYLVYDFVTNWLTPEDRLPPGTYWTTAHLRGGMDDPDPSPPISSVKEFEERIKRGIIRWRTPEK